MRDQVNIRVKAGRGGDGIASFRREKFVPRGGPDGGDGGRGGNVVLVARDKLSSLDILRNNSMYKAESAQPGEGSRKFGRNGEDLVIGVPSGCSVFDAETGALIGDLIDLNRELIVAYGGDGGRGNCHFATPQNRIPQRCEPGLPGQEREIRIILSIPADVGVVGLPNSGKSSLVSALSRSKTVIDDYPFTTRQPYLGTCRVDPTMQFRIIDLPALVEGSHEGRGVGNDFLNHLKRVSVIVFMLDAAQPDGIELEKQFDVLFDEIKKYNPEYVKKRIIVLINKIDSVAKLKNIDMTGRPEISVLSISATTGEGIEELTGTIAESLESEKKWRESREK
ncbi:MAG TPA: Obg family GTPase CgtA [bacterium]|nr:Obg family GTPase CgtA [bacterium]